VTGNFTNGWKLLCELMNCDSRGRMSPKRTVRKSRLRSGNITTAYVTISTHRSFPSDIARNLTFSTRYVTWSKHYVPATLHEAGTSLSFISSCLHYNMKAYGWNGGKLDAFFDLDTKENSGQFQGGKIIGWPWTESRPPSPRYVIIPDGVDAWNVGTPLHIPQTMFCFVSYTDNTL
jgi:hypothetical protein